MSRQGAGRWAEATGSTSGKPNVSTGQLYALAGHFAPNTPELPIFFYDRQKINPTSGVKIDDPNFRFTNFFVGNVTKGGNGVATSSDGGFTVNNQFYACSEVYFQSKKISDDAARKTFIDTCNADSHSPGRKAFNEAKKHQMSPTEVAAWDNGGADKAMWEALWHKYTQNPKLAEALLKTGTATLVEDSPVDTNWGNGKDGTGANKLGRMLMELRDHLNQLAQHNNNTLPDPAALAKAKMPDCPDMTQFPTAYNANAFTSTPSAPKPKATATAPSFPGYDNETDDIKKKKAAGEIIEAAFKKLKTEWEAETPGLTVDFKKDAVTVAGNKTTCQSE